MTKVNVTGYGVFEIQDEHVQELLGWLTSKQGIKITQENTIREVQDNKFTGRELING